MKTYEKLKARHRAVRDSYPANLNLRLHRALSWLKRACMEQEDDDAQFIFLWIAFNAAYACEIDERCGLSEQKTLIFFLEKLCDLDTHRQLDKLVWQSFSDNIRVLLDNPFVFQGFWDFQAGRISEDDWENRFAHGKKMAHQALAGGKTDRVLGVVFGRLYTLRNQLIHGGATWNGKTNRKQLANCTKLLGKLVPAIIEIMLENPEAEWTDPCYPVVKTD